ncbi:hypothetical protein GALMADRAFT_205262 [Galerina marginata CBS 339.88]|uniref:Uncharacterized protein n=1 Tax=Galerina marginata (strain CBS 339.88) TaxID=685588 RepID=A0A067TS53_GALM3|nr:hypothetical protein GALMADRAFT_205262 [Galerina marginata CBS 339.88]
MSSSIMILRQSSRPSEHDDAPEPFLPPEIIENIPHRVACDGPELTAALLLVSPWFLKSTITTGRRLNLTFDVLKIPSRTPNPAKHTWPDSTSAPRTSYRQHQRIFRLLPKLTRVQLRLPPLDARDHESAHTTRREDQELWRRRVEAYWATKSSYPDPHRTGPDVDLKEWPYQFQPMPADVTTGEHFYSWVGPSLVEFGKRFRKKRQSATN